MRIKPIQLSALGCASASGVRLVLCTGVELLRCDGQASAHYIFTILRITTMCVCSELQQAITQGSCDEREVRKHKKSKKRTSVLTDNKAAWKSRGNIDARI